MEAAQAQQISGRRRRFSVDEYRRMAEAEILHEDERVELIGGEVVEMAPLGWRHADCVDRLARVLNEIIILREEPGFENAIVRVQNPIRLDDYRELQPDVALLEGRRAGMPTAQDVLLLIEVSDTSLSYDRNVKLPLYARAGIPEVFIMDLANEAVERHHEPSENGYRHMERVQRGETLGSAALPALALPVDAVLG